LASGLLALALVLAPALTRAQTGVPAAINYQGTLSDNQNHPVPAGYYQVQFKIWDSPTLPDAAGYIWGRSFALYVATNGLFNVLLSDDGGLVGAPQVTNILSAFTSSDRYLGLTIIADTQGTVNSPVEISPRQRLVSAPYAMRANDAANVGGVPAANFPTNTTGLRPYTIPTFVGGALANSALYASGTNRIGINNSSPSVELDVTGAARVSGKLTATTLTASTLTASTLTASGTAQADVLKSRVFSAAVSNNNGIHFSGLSQSEDWAAILLSETANGSKYDHTLSVTVGADKGDSISLQAVGSVGSLASQGTNSVAGATVNIQATSSGTVNVYGNVSAFGADVLLWSGGDLEFGGKTFVAPTDGFMTFHAFNILGAFSVSNSAGTALYGAMLYCRGGEPGNVQVNTVPLAKGDSFHYESQGHGSGSWNAWMRWRPLGR
jgi:hypothetical protein